MSFKIQGITLIVNIMQSVASSEAQRDDKSQLARLGAIPLNVSGKIRF